MAEHTAQTKAQQADRARSRANGFAAADSFIATQVYLSMGPFIERAIIDNDLTVFSNIDHHGVPTDTIIAWISIHDRIEFMKYLVESKRITCKASVAPIVAQYGTHRMLQYLVDAGFNMFRGDVEYLVHRCAARNLSFLNDLSIDITSCIESNINLEKIRALTVIGIDVNRLTVIKDFFRVMYKSVASFKEIVDAGLSPTTGDSYAYVWATSSINHDFKLLHHLRETNVPLPKSQNMITVSAKNKSLRMVDYYIDLGLAPNHYHVLNHYDLMSQSEKVFKRLTMAEIKYIIKRRPKYLEVVKQWDPKFNVGNTCSLRTNCVYTDIDIIAQN